MLRDDVDRSVKHRCSGKYAKRGPPVHPCGIDRHLLISGVSRCASHGNGRVARNQSVAAMPREITLEQHGDVRKFAGLEELGPELPTVR